MNNLDKLKEITEILPEIPNLDSLVGSRNPDSHSIIYDVANGTSFGVNLLSRPEVAVMEMFVSKGTSWPNHVHEGENEWGVVYKGKLKVIVDGEEHILVPGSCIHFSKKSPHSSEALEDTWLVAVSVPRISGYPE